MSTGLLGLIVRLGLEMVVLHARPELGLSLARVPMDV